MIKPLCFILLLLGLLVVSACGDAGAALTQSAPVVPSLPSAGPSDTPAPSETPEPSETPIASPTFEDPIVFAVIGDFGQAGRHAFAVAEMIDRWEVDFIVTTGDNNYQDGEASTIDENVGQYYHRYIANYIGDYNRGSETNRFFPSLGNHDWDSESGAEPYLDYFTLPGNERYYDFTWEYLHFFVIDSDTREPDGVGESSVQAEWLYASMADSELPWQIVVGHFPPYSSGFHGSTRYVQWPFSEWGADLVLSSHDHLYERLEVDGLTYLTVGLSGHAALYEFTNILPESQVRYNQNWGALRVTATRDQILFELITVDGDLIDSFVLEAEAVFQ